MGALLPHSSRPALPTSLAEVGGSATMTAPRQTDSPQHAAELAAHLAAAQEGEQSGFAAVYLELQPRLLRYAGGLVGQDAEDVTAEAWLQIARDIRGFSGDFEAFRGWTARIVRNRAMDLLRARARRPVDPSALDDLLDRPGTDDTATSAVDNAATAAAISLIASLPRDQAEAVLLRAVVGLDAAAAGEVLGKSAGAVRVAAHRGLKALARRLEQSDAAAVRPSEPHL